jgi:hypothetical protein
MGRTKMKLKMVALGRTKAGWHARKCIPADVRQGFKKLYGQSFEVKLSLPASVTAPDAKAQFTAWLSEVESRIANLRADKCAGPLTQGSQGALWRVVFLVCRAAVRNNLARQRGIRLTPDAYARVLDMVALDYDAAASVLYKRAQGDYSADVRPAQFPAFERQGKVVSPVQLFEG